jgi:hypothetical protein
MTRCRSLALALLVLVAASGGTQRVLAAEENAEQIGRPVAFDVINRTRLTVVVLTVTPTRPPSADSAGSGAERSRVVVRIGIAPDTTGTIRIPPRRGCKFDVLIGFATDDERSRPDVDLCKGIPMVLLPGPSDAQSPPRDLPAGPAAAGVPLVRGAAAHVGVASLLARGAQPITPDGIYGMLLLQRSSERNGAICQAFFKQFVAVRDVELSSGPAIRRPTYWPDTRLSSELPNTTTCADLLAHYDWETAGGQLNLHGFTAAGGPFLAVYGPCTAGDKDTIAAAGLDFSAYPDSEIGRAFRIWADILTGDPALWCSAARITNLRGVSAIFY